MYESARSRICSGCVCINKIEYFKWWCVCVSVCFLNFLSMWKKRWMKYVFRCCLSDPPFTYLNNTKYCIKFQARTERKWFHLMMMKWSGSISIYQQQHHQQQKLTQTVIFVQSVAWSVWALTHSEWVCELYVHGEDREIETHGQMHQTKLFQFFFFTAQFKCQLQNVLRCVALFSLHFATNGN